MDGAESQPPITEHRIPNTGYLKEDSAMSKSCVAVWLVALALAAPSWGQGQDARPRRRTQQAATRAVEVELRNVRRMAEVWNRQQQRYPRELAKAAIKAAEVFANHLESTLTLMGVGDEEQTKAATAKGEGMRRNVVHYAQRMDTQRKLLRYEAMLPRAKDLPDLQANLEAAIALLRERAAAEERLHELDNELGELEKALPDRLPGAERGRDRPDPDDDEPYQAPNVIIMG